VSAEPPKRKLKTSYEKWSIQTLSISHLAERERMTGRGSDRDDLIDWYLEQKENEINNVEELEYEKELISKVLNKSAKVGPFPSENSFSSRWLTGIPPLRLLLGITYFWRCKGASRIRYHRRIPCRWVANRCVTWHIPQHRCDSLPFPFHSLRPRVQFIHLSLGWSDFYMYVYCNRITHKIWI
jgi:MCM6 C-terminal winged-helix domain